MERFTDELKELGIELAVTAQIEEHLESLYPHLVNSSDGFLMSPVTKLPWKVFELLQVGTRRSIELSESAIREMNRRNVGSASVLVRGVFETVCLVYEATRRVARAIEKPEEFDIDALSTFLDNTLLGKGPKAKTFVLYEQYTVTNILTIIEKLAKALNAPLVEMYEGLSEHSHPNAPAMILLYTLKHDGGVATFTSRNEERGRVSLLLAMTALSASLGLLNNALKVRKELSDDFATLAEVKIYERGTWPEDLAFPIKRGTS